MIHELLEIKVSNWSTLQVLPFFSVLIVKNSRKHRQKLKLFGYFFSRTRRRGTSIVYIIKIFLNVEI
jgi:hypothetical protein